VPYYDPYAPFEGRHDRRGGFFGDADPPPVLTDAPPPSGVMPTYEI
jgi:hypothetical protein